MTDSKKDPRVIKDKDFVLSKKHEYSLSKLMKDYPDGAPDRVICKVLQISQEELEKHYKRAILNLKGFVN